MNDLVIRAADASDRAALSRLLIAQLEEHRLPVDREGIERAIELALSRGSSAWMVLAIKNGFPVAVLLANPIVSVEHGGASLWIEELYVQPAHRRQGIARALIAFVTNEARNNGLRALDLEVVAGMAAAKSLYASLGFNALNRERLNLKL